MLSGDRDFWRGAATGFFCCLFAAELLCRMATATGVLYRRFDVSGQLTSLPELRDRLRAGRQGGSRILLLGDSVLGAGALAERREPDSRSRSVAHRLRVRLGADGPLLAALNADGLLLPDVEALCREAAPAPADRVLLVLNFRMFAPEFQEPARALSRPFLRPALPEAARADLAPLSREEALAIGVPEAAARLSHLVRTTSLLRALWFFPSQKDLLERGLGPLAASGPDDPDDLVRGAALRLRVASYYRPGAWREDAIAARSLGRILRSIPGESRPVVVLSPQNGDTLRDLGDPADLAARRAFLAGAVKAASPGALLVDWTDRYPPGRFLDHCHLTSAGNEAFAGDLAALLRGAG